MKKRNKKLFIQNIYQYLLLINMKKISNESFKKLVESLTTQVLKFMKDNRKSIREQIRQSKQDINKKVGLDHFDDAKFFFEQDDLVVFENIVLDNGMKIGFSAEITGEIIYPDEQSLYGKRQRKTFELNTWRLIDVWEMESGKNLTNQEIKQIDSDVFDTVFHYFEPKIVDAINSSIE